MRAYTANMIPGGTTPTVNVSQYDNDYAVTVTLIEGAEIYTPPVGATIRVEGTKPDGHGFEYPCTYQGNVVTMPIYTQMTVVSGRFPIELVVYQSGLRVGSCNIIFAVEKAPLGEDTDISETVIPDIIAGAQAQANAAAASATSAASSASSAETAKTAAMGAAEDAIEAAQELQTAVQWNATTIKETASGDMVVISDGSDNIPIQSLVAQIDPIQNLNGQPNPYPPGGGKNLIDDSKRIASTSNQSITFGQTVGYGTPSVPMKAGTYTYTVYFRNGASGQGYMKKEGGENTRIWASGQNHATFTIDEDAVYSFWIYNSAGIVSADVNAQIEVGTTSTDYAPYSNICPISGRTGLTVTAASKNLMPNMAGTATNTTNGITFTYNDDGSFTINGTATANAYSRAVDGVATNIYLPHGTYKKPTAQNGNVGVYVQYMRSASSWTTVTGGGTVSQTCVIDEDYPIAIRMAVMSGTTVNNVRFEPYIYPDSVSDTTWVSPVKTNYPISWQTEAGTIYGGTLDVISGVLTVDKVLTTFDGTGVTWEKYTPSSGNYCFRTTISDKAVGLTPMYANSYKSLTEPAWGTSDYGVFSGHATLPQVYFRPPNASVAEVADWNTWLAANNLQVVYPLATPQTYQLTPTEVRTLLGGNTIYTDAGEVTVEYVADTKLYIDNKIAELQALVLEN